MQPILLAYKLRMMCCKLTTLRVNQLSSQSHRMNKHRAIMQKYHSSCYSIKTTYVDMMYMHHNEFNSVISQLSVAS